MKQFIKKRIVTILARQVKRLKLKKDFKTIVIAGSIGKTSTKLAIASVLSQNFKVQYQEGNYNDIVSVPLIYFGQNLPTLWNPFAWLGLLFKNESIIRKPYPYEYVILELGTDGPGQIKQFKKYIDADIGVLTAIAPEHMEFFTDLETVANEELAVAELCKTLVVNKDLCDAKYVGLIKKNILTYGINSESDYRLINIKPNNGQYDFDVLHNDKAIIKATHETVSEAQFYSLCAACAVADIIGLSGDNIEKGIKLIKPVSGRMQHLRGINNSQIIDDTYNASPYAMKSALDTLYNIDSNQKIAILGNMNELGAYSQQAHTDIGNFCDPKKLDIVVTIGPDANKFLASAAQQRGCTVKTFTNPYQAGEYLKPLVKPGAVILAKGSQNAVFAEETVKVLLADPADSSKLVRQSPHWLKLKRKQFVSAQ